MVSKTNTHINTSAWEKVFSVIQTIPGEHSVSDILLVFFITTTTFCVSPKMRPNQKIRPSTIFQDYFNISPIPKITTSY